ncbi:hypothetical protein [Krasilnikovia sp. M28-CT-15]|uniref:hypothetical protein n=1 Tax=Krasilnikovia sp. M28-CT-15 TaxID=3373540 RepID=UPI0038775801
MTAPRAPQISVGDVIHAAEPDYRYGRGTLRLRVTAVGAVRREPDGSWQELEGHEIFWNGDTDQRVRHAMVRLRAVRIVAPEDER